MCASLYSHVLVVLALKLCYLASILYWNVVVIIYHRQIQVVRWQVLPATNEWVVCGRTGIIRVWTTLVFTGDEGREQATHWVHNKLTGRNSYTKAVGHALEFAFFYKSWTLRALFFSSLSRNRVHSHCDYRVKTFRCDETWVSGSVGRSLIVDGFKSQLWSWKTAELHTERDWNWMSLGPTKVSGLKILPQCGLWWHFRHHRASWDCEVGWKHLSVGRTCERLCFCGVNEGCH